MTTVAWLRRDLRVTDNPVLSGDRVVVLYVLDPRLFHPGHRRSDALLARLHALDATLATSGGRLRVHHGLPEDVVPRVAAEVGAEAVAANLDVGPLARRRDAAVGARVPLVGTWATLVHPPDALAPASGPHYRVFTPYHRAWQGLDASRRASASGTFADDPGEGLPPLPGGAQATGEVDAWRRVEDWADGPVDAYHEVRDRPDIDGTSGISIDLKYGTVDPRSVMARVGDHTEGRRAFLRQLAWRDFWAQMLWHRPDTVDRPLRDDLVGLPWRAAPQDLAAWRDGATGIPIVDAAMRCLAATGWLHNRLRMVVGSFLVKHLLVDWREGERWFRDQLLDGDLAQNVGNWQWVAGTGADAAPFFRVFNPVTQGEKFDPDGTFVRRWVPELAEVPTARIHRPWELGPLELAAAGVVLGDTYPWPIVHLAEGRERALAVWSATRADG